MNEAQLSTHKHTHTRSSNSLWRHVVIHTLDLPSAFSPSALSFSPPLFAVQVLRLHIR